MNPFGKLRAGKSFPIVVLVVFVVAGAGYWFYRSRSGEKESPPLTSEFAGTIAEALETGASMKCTWRDGDDAAAIFVKGDRYRGEITSDGESVDYLYVAECLYQWKDAEAQGSKMCWVPVEGEGMLPPEEMTAPVPELGYTYTCRPSLILDSFFTPPAEIEF